MKNLNFIDKIGYFINTILAVALLLSYLLPYISPISIPFFAILSLFVPPLIFINFIFVIYWLVKLKKQLILSLLVLGLGWFLNISIFKISKSDDNDEFLETSLKVMSYNVRTFNHWKWIDNENVEENIFKFIEEKNTDIILFQEYYKLDREPKNYNYKFIETKNDKDKIGLAIFSKFPIINKGSLNLKNTFNNIIFADILKDNDTIRVYNIHLQSLKLNTEKENFGHENSEKLLTRLKQQFKKQADQTNKFVIHDQNWKGKKIVGGDFNNTSYSWVYNQIAKNKKDAFIEAGNGFGKTFKYWFPLRIDFILTDDNATIQKFESFSNQTNSDHFPIIANINW